MCVSMGVKCGACLAKWNGNTWDDSYKCMVSLKSWSLRMNDDYQLCLEGRCDLDIILEVCIPITNRLTNFWVTGQDILVKFHGVLNRKNLPDYIVKKFSDGIPHDWKEVSIKWREYIQRGRRSTFCWELNQSPVISLTSMCSSRSSRRSGLRGESKNAKLQKKRDQRKQTAPPKATEVHRDSGIPTSNEDSNTPQELASAASSNSLSRWLPADKLRDINKWIHSSYDVSPDAASDVGNESASTETFLRLFQGNASFTSQTSGSTSCMPNLPTSVENAALQRVKPVISQSTPEVSACDTRTMADAFNLDVSAIAEISHSDISVQYSNAASDVFRKPMQGLAAKTNTVRTDGQRRPSLRGRTVPKTRHSQTLPQPSAVTSELPGRQIVQRENSTSLRPQRKRPNVKIERWRPVLGVDGNLKVQGYLLLGGDMTACQILTTNTVIEWGDKKVRTCDRREFELVGDSYGKIPDNLKRQLLEPMDCKVIKEKLKKFQSIKADVTRCVHLAPPPAPKMINTTRSGRLCRPCAPYWLNRSDWGAEYDLFYEEDTSCASNSRTFQGRSRDVRTSPQNPTAKHNRTVGNQALSSRNTSQARRSFSDTRMKSNVAAVPSTPPQNALCDAPGLQNEMSFPRTDSSSASTMQRSPRIRRKKENNKKSNSSPDDLDRSSTEKSQAIHNSSPVIQQNIDTLNQSFKNNNHVHSDANFEQIPLIKQNKMMMPSARLQNDCTIVHFSPSRIKVSYVEKTVSKDVHSSLVNVQSVTNDLNSCETPKRPSRSPVKRPCFPCCETPVSTFPRKHAPSSPTSRNVSKRRRVPDSEATESPAGRRRLSAHRMRIGHREEIPGNKTPVKSPIKTRSVDSNHVYKTRRPILCEPRILLRRLDTRKFASEGNVQLNELSENVSAASISLDDKRKRKSKESKAEREPVKEGKNFVKEQQKTNEKNEDYFKNKVSKVAKRESVGKKKVAPNGKKNVPTVRNEVKRNQKMQTKVHKKVPKTNSRNKTSARKSGQGQNRKNRCTSSDGESDRMKDNASVCSESSEISVGPSASVVFAMNAELPTPRGAPRTLKERRMRDEELVKLGNQLAARETIAAEDDPMANLIAVQKFAAFPQEWCRHENFLRKNRKRRTPSSSDETASPRSGVSDNFGNEDATSSVQTPQLLMRQPDQKQVQSYLQRQRALIAKAQRPTRQMKRDRALILPIMDYSAPFRKNSDSSDSSSDASDSEWEG